MNLNTIGHLLSEPIIVSKIFEQWTRLSAKLLERKVKFYFPDIVMKHCSISDEIIETRLRVIERE